MKTIIPLLIIPLSYKDVEKSTHFVMVKLAWDEIFFNEDEHCLPAKND